MKEIWPQYDLAIHQLGTAIDLFLNKQDYICTITLAGAAEEILGKLVEEKGIIPAQRGLASSLIRNYDLKVTEKKLRDNHLNYPRNSLKHLNPMRQAALEPQIEAITMIVRAIDNMILLDRSVTYNSRDFFEWLNGHHQDLNLDADVVRGNHEFLSQIK